MLFITLYFLGWTTCFEHELKGPITKISEKNSYEDSQTQFAILYHQVENDNSLHYVRIYYTTTNEEGNGFKYKDILLPGSTWINAISLENDSLIYSRYVFTADCFILLFLYTK